MENPPPSPGYLPTDHEVNQPVVNSNSAQSQHRVVSDSEANLLKNSFDLTSFIKAVTKKYQLDSRILRRSGWVVVIALSIFPVIYWLVAFPINDNFQTPYQIFSSLGKILGLAGVCLYSTNLILGSRLKFLEIYFGGMNRLYFAHHIFGGLALVLLLFHPFFLAMRYATVSFNSAATFLIPQFSGGLLDRNWSINYGIITLLGLVTLLIITFYFKLPYQLWLLTHKLLGIVFFVAILHVLFVPGDLAYDLFLKGYILALMALAGIAFTYRTLLKKYLIRKHNYYVDEVRKMSPDVAEIALRPVKKAIKYNAGQFVFIRFLYGGIKTEWHPFSISAGPNESQLTITVKGLGDYTKTLLDLQKGSIAEIEGPFGRFSPDYYNNPNQVWVAGGIGITPFLAMAQNLKDQNCHIDLFYSVKKREELVGIPELSAAITELGTAKFEVVPFISEEQGMLTAQYIDTLVGGVSGKDIFLCGPPPMMGALRKQFKTLKVPNWRIHSEEFSIN